MTATKVKQLVPKFPEVELVVFTTTVKLHISYQYCKNNKDTIIVINFFIFQINWDLITTAIRWNLINNLFPVLDPAKLLLFIRRCFLQSSIWNSFSCTLLSIPMWHPWMRRLAARGDEPGSLQIHTESGDPEWKNHVGWSVKLEPDIINWFTGQNRMWQGHTK